MTQFTTTFSRGDVVFVPSLFMDRQAAKNRPAVVISSEAYHRSRREIIIAGVTSNTRRSFVGQSSIEDWSGCGLLRPSVVSGIIMTIRSDQVRRKIGALSQPDLGSLETALKETLSLS
jgi:mRNA interferase MazF